MFNKTKINQLESQLRSLKVDVKFNYDRYWTLYHELNALKAYLGVKRVDIPKQTVMEKVD